MMLPIAFAPAYAHPLPAGHRFPMLKYELLPEQLLREGTATAADFLVATPPPVADILLVHDADYYERLRLGQLTRQEERATGFPWSVALFEREITILGGTIEAARLALVHGVAFNIAGGTHHAFRARGEGFCLLNDQAAAAAWLLAHVPPVRKVLIVDLDVHQGNGTAALFADEPRVLTVSVHGANNYPFQKAEGDLDVALPDATGDAAYLAALDREVAPAVAAFRPDFAFYLAGADVLEGDQLGKLALTLEGLRERDDRVFRWAARTRTPLVTVMAGGYHRDPARLIAARLGTLDAALAAFQPAGGVIMPG